MDAAFFIWAACVAALLIWALVAEYFYATKED